MRCPRCAAEVDDAADACGQCGITLRSSLVDLDERLERALTHSSVAVTPVRPMPRVPPARRPARANPPPAAAAPPAPAAAPPRTSFPPLRPGAPPRQVPLM